MAGKRKMGKRTSSGRLSRARGCQPSAEPVTDVVIETRMRRYGLSRDEARDQRAATVIGRLVLRKRLPDEMFLVSQRYLDARTDYHVAMSAPSDMRAKVSGAAGDDVTEQFADWCSRAKARWSEIDRRVTAAQVLLRRTNLLAALDYIVVRDEEHEHMVADAGIALSVIAVTLGMAECRGLDISCEAA